MTLLIDMDNLFKVSISKKQAKELLDGMSTDDREAAVDMKGDICLDADCYAKAKRFLGLCK